MVLVFKIQTIGLICTIRLHFCFNSQHDKENKLKITNQVSSNGCNVRI